MYKRQQLGGLGSPAGSGAEPQPKSNLVHFSLKICLGKYFAHNPCCLPSPLVGNGYKSAKVAETGVLNS